MAILASTRSEIVIVVDVARRAGNVGVAIGQRESSGAMIENCCGPTDGVVTPSAISSGKGWASGSVRRIIGLLPLG